jgi:predicted nucleic acid-binding protein
VYEIVIDANVFAHALNPDVKYFESALGVVQSLLEHDLILALDDTGKASPSTRTSNLYREYTECVPVPSLSSEVIRSLLNDGRVTFHPRPARELWKRCRELAPRNSNDAIVLGIGVQADRHEIVSNDYADFSVKVRRLTEKRIGVKIVDSDQFSGS